MQSNKLISVRNTKKTDGIQFWFSLERNFNCTVFFLGLSLCAMLANISGLLCVMCVSVLFDKNKKHDLKV